ncbi:unnamed protein product [Penicillium nalgiovense]|nr:unnamed protein product [Penicillium nalgiovense]
MDDETHASTDLERNDARFLMNQSVKDFSWSGLTVTVKDRETKQARDLICDISVNVKQAFTEAKVITRQVSERAQVAGKDTNQVMIEAMAGLGPVRITTALLHRSFSRCCGLWDSYCDVSWYVSCGCIYVPSLEISQFIGLAIMMGTVWLRLHTSQEYIQPFVNAIFFGGSFMSFMAVAYVPAFLKDRATFAKERANGLYGATPFMVSNFVIGLLFLFPVSYLFSIVSYWLSNFRPAGDAFFTSIMWIFLDLVTAIFPNFVIALALVAFANGPWMSVGGSLVTPTILNPLWKYVFHYIDYQTYAFQGLMVNEFSKRIFLCGDACQCTYTTDLADQCQICGTAVLETYGYKTGRTGKSHWNHCGIQTARMDCASTAQTLTLPVRRSRRNRDVCQRLHAFSWYVPRESHNQGKEHGYN